MGKDAKIVLLTLSILLMIGIVMIYSSSAVYADGNCGDSMFFVKRHLMYLVVGLIAAVLCMMIPAPKIAANARWIMLGAIILLVAVLIPGIGKNAGGARRWMRFFGIGFQPSEIAKLALILYLADLTSRKRYLMQNLRYGFLPAIFVIFFAGGLVFLEPDMGTCVSMVFVGLVILFTSGARMKYLITIAASMLPALWVAVKCEPYRLRRVLTFFDPFKDARGGGFQLVQSFIALGSGGLWGVGLGESRQKLFYLPASHTDFIFSIIGEELGFAGGSVVLILFAVLIWFSLRIAFRLGNRFAANTVLGISVMTAFEVIVNIGVSTGILPTKGLPLPFISYGGTSLVCHLAAMGIVLNMAREVE